MTNLPAAIKHFSGNGYDHTVEHLQFSGVPTTVIDTGLQTKGHTNSRGSRVAPWSYTTYQSEPETDIAGYGIRAKVIWRTASTSKGRVYDNVGTPTVTLFKRDAGATSRPGIKTKKDKESEVAFEYPCPVDHAQIVAALVGAGETPEAARVYEDAISHGKKEACDRKLWSMTSFHISNAKDLSIRWQSSTRLLRSSTTRITRNGSSAGNCRKIRRYISLPTIMPVSSGSCRTMAGRRRVLLTLTMRIIPQRPGIFTAVLFSCIPNSDPLTWRK